MSIIDGSRAQAESDYKMESELASSEKHVAEDGGDGVDDDDCNDDDDDDHHHHHRYHEHLDESVTVGWFSMFLSSGGSGHSREPLQSHWFFFCFVGTLHVPPFWILWLSFLHCFLCIYGVCVSIAVVVCTYMPIVIALCHLCCGRGVGMIAGRPLGSRTLEY